MGGGLGFAWGKPVMHTTHDRKKRLLISFAGPAMNVILAALVPAVVAGGSEFELTARGQGFAAGDRLVLDGKELPTRFISAAVPDPAAAVLAWA